MIKHPLTDQKITANQLAKWHVIDALELRADDPTCYGCGEFESMTDKERKDFFEALNKQIRRVEKFLNV